MAQSTHPPQPGYSRKICISSCCALLLFIALTPCIALAQSKHASSHDSGPSFTVHAGFDARYRQGNWIPIQVALRNSGADFNGTIAVNVPSSYSSLSSNTGSHVTYQSAVSLASGAQKQIILYVPYNSGTPGSIQALNVNLLDANGRMVSSQAATLRALSPTDVFVGILSDQSTGFGPLTSVPLADQTASVITEPLNAATMPANTEALENFDLLIIDNFTTSSLSQAQLATLQNWVRQGGNLIIVGGPEWRSTLSPLPSSLLPVTPTDTTTLPAGTQLLPFTGEGNGAVNQPSGSIAAPIVASTGAVTAGSHVIQQAADGTPVIVQQQQEQGSVYYLAFDPTLDPVANWSNASSLWKSLLLRTLGDQILIANPGINSSNGWTNSGLDNMGAVLQSLFPTSFLATWMILVLLVGYILVLGPVRLVIVRKAKNRDWSWRIALSTIAVFSLLSYGLALQQKGTSILSSSIAVMQLDQQDGASTTAHATTYVGVFVPNQGDFQVHVPGFSLVQPSTMPNRMQSQIQPQPTTITETPSGIDTNLQGVNIWSLRTIVSQNDRQLPGGITSHLTLQNDTLTGTVTNTLAYALSDVYILVDGHYQSLGHLGARETRPVALSLKNGPSGPQGTSFADQIASSKGLPIPFSYYANTQNQGEVQRHMAMLAALSGEYMYGCGTFPCTRGYMHSTITSGGMVINGNGTYNLAAYNQILNGNDPLVIPKAQATLIGWVDRPNDTAENITINGDFTSKLQEALIEAPLSINFADPVNLSPTFINSQVVNVASRGTDVQTLYSGVYALSAGSMTFEYTMPAIANQHAKSFIVSAPTSLPQVGSASSQNTLDANHIAASLYNWQTHKWDAYTFSVFTFSTNKAQQYVGPGGQVLLRCANPDSTEGTIIFGKPSLQLQDSVAGQG